MRITQAFILFLCVTATMGALPRHRADTPQRIAVVARRFSFEPAEITVHKGQPVTLELSSSDVTHGLTVNELGIRTDVRKGKTTEVSFTPQTTGTFTGKCSHFCGAGHGSMNLTIRVIE